LQIELRRQNRRMMNENEWYSERGDVIRSSRVINNTVTEK
jgi:hypothetical protein